MDKLRPFSKSLTERGGKVILILCVQKSLVSIHQPFGVKKNLAIEDRLMLANAQTHKPHICKRNKLIRSWPPCKMPVLDIVAGQV